MARGWPAPPQRPPQGGPQPALPSRTRARPPSALRAAVLLQQLRGQLADPLVLRKDGLLDFLDLPPPGRRQLLRRLSLFGLVRPAVVGPIKDLEVVLIVLRAEQTRWRAEHAQSRHAGGRSTQPAGCTDRAPCAWARCSAQLSVQTAVLSLRVRTRLQSCALGALSEQQSASAPAPRTGA